MSTAVLVRIAIVTLCLFPLVTARAVAKDGKPKSAQEKRDNERVRDAQKDLSEAKEQISDAQKDLKQAEQAHHQAEIREKAATKAIEAVRDKVEARLGKSIGLDKALADQKEAQAAFDQSRTPVLEALKASPDYQATARRGSEAMEALKALRANRDPTDETLKSRLSELTKQTLAAGQLESEAVANDPAAKSAREKLTERQAKVAALREKIRKEVESDPEMKSARAEAESAHDAARSAFATVNKERGQFAKAQQTLAQRQFDLQKAQAQDKKNDGKKNGK